jgi:hypothetical protein
LVNEQAANAGMPPAGFINPTIYWLGGRTNYAACFHDITTGNNTNINSHNLFFAVAGYDLCTGWGTPTGSNLITALATPDPLQVPSFTNFNASGPQGGPFAPMELSESISNVGTTTLTWAFSVASPWVTATPSGGTLAPGTVTNVMVSLNSDADSLSLGSYTNNLTFSDVTDGFAQVRQATLVVLPANIQNGAFETGTFSNWTQSGTVNYTYVSTNSLYAYTNTYGAELGPGSLGYLSQTVGTDAGQSYVLSFWLDSPDGLGPNEFLVSWNGTNVFNQTNLAKTGWTNLQFTVTATGSSTVVEFGFFDGGTYLGLDDITLVPTTNSIPDYTVTAIASPANGGTLSGGGTYASNTSVTVTATPTNGFVFTNWTDNNGNPLATTTNYTFTLTSNVTLDAHFLPLYTVALASFPASGGTVSGGGTFASNTSVTVTATTNNGFVFTNWTDNNGNPLATSTNYTFTLTSNVTLDAHFLPLYTVALSSIPVTGGAVSGGGTFASNTSVTVIATASNGFVFTNWTGTNGNALATSTNYTFTLTSNVTLDAHFLPLYNVTLASFPTNGGAVSGGGTYVSNTSVTVTATVSNGFVFTNWTDNNGNPLATSTNYTFTLTSNVTLDAHFLPLYTLSLSNSPTNGGMVTGGQTVASNTTVTATAAPDPGFAFTNWTYTVADGAVASLSNPYIFPLVSNVTLFANYVTTPPRIGVSVGTNVLTNGDTTAVDFGTVQPNTNGLRVTFTVTNAGGQTLELEAITAPTNYIVNTNYPPTIAALSNGSFGVELVTTNVGTFTGNIAITNNDPTLTNGTFAFAVSGTVLPSAPELEVFYGTSNIANGQTNAVNFGSVPQDATGPTLAFAITNAGQQTLVVTNITAPAGFIVSPNLSTNITAGGSGAFSVALLTTNMGNFSGVVSIVNNAPGGSPFSFPVMGTVTAPQPQMEVFNGTNAITNGQTNAVAIGQVAQGQTGPVETFTVSNVGFAALTLSNITVPAGFALGTNTDLPLIIAAGSNGTFNVQLLSANLGSPSGPVTIADNDANNNPFSFPISGFVFDKIISTGGSLDFGVVPLGSSNQVGFIISNAGNAPLTVSSITYPFPAVLNGNWESGPIPAGGSQQVTVTFAPAAPTNYSGVVTIALDATGGSSTMPLTAFGANHSLLLTILTNGPGKVTPNDAKFLKQGARVSLTAVPGSGQVFAGWIGSTNSTNNPLVFKMASNTIVQVNFVPNPFLPFVGTYNGLFWSSNGVSESAAGLLKGLTLTAKGSYSALLLIDGASHGISGSFDLAGQAGQTVKVGGREGTVNLSITLTSNAPAPLVTGTISNANGSWVATNLMAERATNNDAISSAYTMLLPPDTNVASSPAGYGYGLISAQPGSAKTPASARIAGVLADGTAFSQSTTVSLDSYVPVYVSLYGGKGALLGWINLDSTNASPAALYWVHPAITASSAVVKAPFVSTNQIGLSPWSNVAGIYGGLTNLLELGSPNGTNAVTNIFVDIGPDGRASASNATVTIAPKTGALTITIGSGASRVTGHGVVLLNGTNGACYFLTKTNTGAILLQP